MPGKELVKVDHNALVVKEQAALPFSMITYECKDDSYYFSKTIDGEQYIEWQEAEQDYETSEFVDTDFNIEVPDTKKEYYIVAAASGFLTATLSTLRLSDLINLKDELAEKDFRNYIIIAAKAMGYKKSDYKGAVRFIKGMATRFIDSSIPSSTKEYLRDLGQSFRL